jgi:4-amino-4-deoxy-L-arabinose transferase-like glycosyltransferase
MKIIHAISSKIKSFFQSVTENSKKYGWPIRMLAIVAVLLLASRGQLALSSNQFVDGLGSYAVALVIFLFVIRGIDKLSPPDENDRALMRRYVPLAILWSISVLMLQYTLMHMNDNYALPGQQYFIDISWLLSIVTFSAGVLWISPLQFPRFSFDKTWFKENRTEIIGVALIGLAAFALRFYQLLDNPYPVHKDEGNLGLESLKILWGQIANFFNPGWATNPVWISIPYSASIAIFGNTIFAIRILSVLMGTLSILILYFLARDMFDRWTAVIAAGVLIALPVHLHFSRLGVTNIAVPLWACAVILLTLRAIKRDKVQDYLWAGLACGSTFYTYSGARLAFALGFFVLFIRAISKRGYLRSHILHLAVFSLSAGIVVAPILYFLYRRPEYAMVLYNSAGIIQSGWLAAEPRNSGRTIPSVLLDQFARSTLVFISQGAYGGEYFSPKPYLTPWLAVFFMLGMAYSLSQISKAKHIILQAWFWSVVIMGSMLTINPPTSERLLGSLPPMAIFIALGLNLIIDVVKRMGLISARIFDGLRVVLILVMIFQGVDFYFGEYQQGRYFEHRPEELEITLVESLLPPCDKADVYLLTQPITRADYFPVRDYVIPGLKMKDLTDLTPQALASLPKNNGMLFAAILEYQDQLKMVANAIPGGKWTEVPRRPIPDRPPEVLLYVYQVPASQADSCPVK